MRKQLFARIVTASVALGAAGVVFADQAKPRGQSGGGGSSSAGARHHSPSGGSGSGGSSSGSSGSSGSSRSLSPAERWHPRPGTGTGYRGRYYGGYYGNPYYYYPGWGYWYRPGYYPGYYNGYWPYWGFGYGWGGGYYGGYYGGVYRAPYAEEHDSDAGALRLIVEPEDTKVYVDGYFAGEVDRFDGLSQRLHLSPGRHEILLKKDGYRSHRIKVYLERGETLKLRHFMEKGLGPDTLDDQAGDRGLDEERSLPRRDDDADEAEEDEGEEGSRPTPPPVPFADQSGTPGLLALRVTPDDASVYVDGRFFGDARSTGEIELSPGPHRVEIVRPGFKTLERDVVVEAGRTRTLGLSLERP